MRIRQRKVPLPLSYLSPIPLSDPLLNRSPVVQLQLHSNPLGNLFQGDDAGSYLEPRQSTSSDPPNPPIAGGENLQDCFDGPAEQEDKKVLLMVGEDESVGEESIDIRKGTALAAKTLQQPSSFRQVLGSWSEGEKAFPLKKRRGSSERRLVSELETTVAEDKKMRTKTKTKLNKKHVKEGYDKERNEIADNAKMRSRGSALLEGSRCSRVNGRGWRCCQPTLVGYSLCEHHLGKGRLRSMTSVRSRSMGTNGASKKDTDMPLSSPVQVQKQDAKMALSSDDNDRIVGMPEDDNEKKLLVASKKKMKLGVVKARSMSSLLGQANSAIVAENSE